MPGKTINLQNTPDRPGVMSKPVEFQSNAVTLRGNLYRPAGEGGQLPGVIVAGAWTTVKEQMPGTYARELAARGAAALAFDFTGWGASDGGDRFIEDPKVKIGDIHAAVDFMTNLEGVLPGAVSGVGVSGSSAYIAEAAADNPKLARLALVAPWLHNPEIAEGFYGGPDTLANLRALSTAAEVTPIVQLAASPTHASSVMYQRPYYTECDRGLISAYDNKFNARSWEKWLSYDAFASTPRQTKPTLMVGSPSIELPAGAAEYEARLNAPIEKLWLSDDVLQFDFYDREDVVAETSDAITRFFGRR
ncbi:MAG: alpha/beta hydrolase [Hyphomicrobiales bacterium]|nr:alpha/beta hydrolase [Hyphomicrobiales bacterium]